MPDFSQVQRRKIKRALIRHCFDQGGSWNKLHYDMRTKLKMQDNDKRLHERDPRNFCVDGIEASEPKLALYYDFLISLDQGIDLSDEDEKSNEIVSIIFVIFSCSRSDGKVIFIFKNDLKSKVIFLIS